jgi:multidrug efflux pump subunit AcrA (membrane-fusion protein)
MKKITFIFSLMLGLVLLLTACGAKKPDTTGTSLTPVAGPVIAEGHLVPNQSLYLAFPAAGRVEEVLVKTGDAVSEGQALILLGDSEPPDAALTAAKMELTLAQQAYDTLVRTAGVGHAQAQQAYIDAQKARAAAQLVWDRLDLTAIQTDIDNAQAEVTNRQSDLETAQTDFDKYSDLATDNATRQSYEDTLRTAQTNYDLAVQKLEDIINHRDTIQAALDAALAAETEAKHAYENTMNGPDADKLALAQARLDNAKAQVAAAQKAVNNYTLKAPFAGIVADVNVSAHQLIGPETWAVALVDASRWYVDTSDLTELDIVKVSPGQKVEVTADALPGVTMTGVVDEISAAPKVQGGDVLYTVHIRLDDPDPQLLWGMTVEVTFISP